MINYPIDNHREAIEVLKNKKLVDFSILEKIKSDVNFDIGLVFIVIEKDNNWEATITTKKCYLLFLANTCLTWMVIPFKLNM